jgi:hypothetical protein
MCGDRGGQIVPSHIGGSEKAGKVQRFVGHSFQEEQKMVATVGQKNERTDECVAGLKQKNKIVGWNATHKK